MNSRRILTNTLQRAARDLKTLEELIKFNDENKEKELPKFGQELFMDSQKKGDLTDKAYTDALAKIKKCNAGRWHRCRSCKR